MFLREKKYIPGVKYPVTRKKIKIYYCIKSGGVLNCKNEQNQRRHFFVKDIQISHHLDLQIKFGTFQTKP